MKREQTKKGYEIYEDILAVEECDRLVRKLKSALVDGRAGARNLFQNSAVRDLALDRRLMRIAAEFVASPVPFKAILFDKSPCSNWLVPWHQDRVLPLKDRFVDPEWGPWTKKGQVHFAQAPKWAMDRIVALRIHLNPSTMTNGPLRVIPRSHEFGILDQTEVVKRASNTLPVICTVSKGGIIAMRPLLIHSSSKASAKLSRRVLHIEYADSLVLAENIEIALS